MESYREDTEFDEAEDFEFGGDEAEAFETAEELDETEEMELASQLLEITDEAELDQFLGRLIMRAGRAAGRLARSGAGRALGGILKGAAKKALPILGGAIGASPMRRRKIWRPLHHPRLRNKLPTQPRSRPPGATPLE